MNLKNYFLFFCFFIILYKHFNTNTMSKPLTESTIKIACTKSLELGCLFKIASTSNNITTSFKKIESIENRQNIERLYTKVKQILMFVEQNKFNSNSKENLKDLHLIFIDCLNNNDINIAQILLNLGFKSSKALNITDDKGYTILDYVLLKLNENKYSSDLDKYKELAKELLENQANFGKLNERVPKMLTLLKVLSEENATLKEDIENILEKIKQEFAEDF